MTDTTRLARWMTWLAAHPSLFSPWHGWCTPWPPRTGGWFGPVRTEPERRRP